MLDFVTCYEKLKVSETATTAEIKKQWRKLVFEIHPDKLQNSPQRVRELAEEELKELNDAWDVLKDAARRADYDELLKKARQNAARNDAAQAARDAVDRAAQAAQDAADQAAQARAAKAAQDAADRAAQVKAAHASANATRARAAKRAADRAADRKMKSLALAMVLSMVLGIFGLTSIGKYLTRETSASTINQALQSMSHDEVKAASRNKENETWPEPKRTVLLRGIEGGAELDHLGVYVNCLANRGRENTNYDACRKFLSVDAWRQVRDNPKNWWKLYDKLPEVAQSWFVSNCGNTGTGVSYWTLCTSYKTDLDDACHRGANDPAGESEGVQPLIGSRVCKLWNEVIANEPKVCMLASDGTSRKVITTELRIRFGRVATLIKTGKYWYRGENGPEVFGYHNESGSTTYWRIPKAEGGEICKDTVDN